MNYFNAHLMLTAACSSLATGNCLAQESGDNRRDRSTEKFSMYVGAYFPSTTTRVRVDASDGTLGSAFVYEEKLKLDDSDVSIDIGLLWRINRKHSIDLEYFDIRRDGNTTLDANINFGDVIFQDQLEVDSFLNSSVLRAGYAYSFINSPSNELGLHVGLHITEIETGITATLGGGGGAANEVVGTTAPLPVVGLVGEHRFADRWVLYGRVQYFQLEFDKYDGKMTQLNVGVEHNTFEKVSFGLGYRYFDINVDIDESDWVGNVDFEYSGPTLYLRYGF